MEEEYTELTPEMLEDADSIRVAALMASRAMLTQTLSIIRDHFHMTGPSTLGPMEAWTIPFGKDCGFEGSITIRIKSHGNCGTGEEVTDDLTKWAVRLRNAKSREEAEYVLKEAIEDFRKELDPVDYDAADERVARLMRSLGIDIEVMGNKPDGWKGEYRGS